MADNDLYSRNPARDVEQYAISVVRTWVGSAGSVRDMSATADPDLAIDYADGRRGIGEVGWHEDPVVQKMWKRIFQEPEHQVIRLPAGYGRWGMGLQRDALINRILPEVPTLIADLNNAGITRLEPEYANPNNDLARRAQGLGVQYLARTAEDGDDMEGARVIYFPSYTGGVIPTDTNEIVDWIDALLADPAYADATAKLLHTRGVDERHIFIMSGSATPFGVDQLLQRTIEQVPTRPPNTHPEITHLWLASRWGRNDSPDAVCLWTEGMWRAVVGAAGSKLPVT
jgi:hypothetical protein